MKIFRPNRVRFARAMGTALWTMGFLWLAPEVHAQLTATPAEVDLGKRAQNKTVESEVTLTNHGADSIEILHVGADCSCTAATPEKTSLKPGESTALKISLETRSYEGEVHRRIQVQASEGDVFVQVKAFVSAYENWSVLPYPLIMPPGNKGIEASTSVQFTYTGAGNGEVKGVTSKPAWLSATLTKQEGKTFTYSLTRLATVPAGNHTIKVTVETSDAVNPHLDLNVFASVLSTVHLKPNPLLMPAAKVGQAVTLDAKLSGWTQAADPRFELKTGTVKTVQRTGEEISFQIEIVPAITGSSTQLLRIYAGDSLELEAPLVLRAQP